MKNKNDKLNLDEFAKICNNFINQAKEMDEKEKIVNGKELEEIMRDYYESDD